MTNFSNTSLSPVEDGTHRGNVSNNTWTLTSNSSSSGLELDVRYIILAVLLCICIVGLVGNGTVIYLLSFHIKRSSFMTYVLNLAAADFGVLLVGSVTVISQLAQGDSYDLFVRSLVTISCVYDASQLLLMAISIDRCLSVLFPIWYRCHRPRHLSTIVSTLIWVFAYLSSGSVAIIYSLTDSGDDFLAYLFIVGAVVCLPLVTISTMILFFKVFCKLQLPRRGKLLTIILLTLLFFLIFAFPLNAIVIVIHFVGLNHPNLISCGILSACLNSCVNPVIYYMVGRKKSGQERQNLKVILQRVFKEEEEPTEEMGTTAQTQP